MGSPSSAVGSGSVGTYLIFVNPASHNAFLYLASEKIQSLKKNSSLVFSNVSFFSNSNPLTLPSSSLSDLISTTFRSFF